MIWGACCKSISRFEGVGFFRGYGGEGEHVPLSLLQPSLFNEVGPSAPQRIAAGSGAARNF